MRPVPYSYRVHRAPPSSRDPWQLSVIVDADRAERMATYKTRKQAVTTARLLAGRAGGRVEVRA